MVKTFTADPHNATAVSVLGKQIAIALLTGDAQAWAELFIERKRGGRVVLTANVTK